jgi:hypothetical protein
VQGTRTKQQTQEEVEHLLRALKNDTSGMAKITAQLTEKELRKLKLEEVFMVKNISSTK